MKHVVIPCVAIFLGLADAAAQTFEADDARLETEGVVIASSRDGAMAACVGDTVFLFDSNGVPLREPTLLPDGAGATDIKLVSKDAYIVQYDALVVACDLASHTTRTIRIAPELTEESQRMYATTMDASWPWMRSSLTGVYDVAGAGVIYSVRLWWGERICVNTSDMTIMPIDAEARAEIERVEAERVSTTLARLASDCADGHAFNPHSLRKYVHLAGLLRLHHCIDDLRRLESMTSIATSQSDGTGELSGRPIWFDSLRAASQLSIRRLGEEPKGYRAVFLTHEAWAAESTGPVAPDTDRPKSWSPARHGMNAGSVRECMGDPLMAGNGEWYYLINGQLEPQIWRVEWKDGIVIGVSSAAWSSSDLTLDRHLLN